MTTDFLRLTFEVAVIFCIEFKLKKCFISMKILEKML